LIAIEFAAEKSNIPAPFRILQPRPIRKLRRQFRAAQCLIPLARHDAQAE